jgi:hypothetical protein
MLSKEKRIAYFMSLNLGDFVFSMIAVNNLVRNGYQVIVYNGYAPIFHEQFPYVIIKKYHREEFCQSNIGCVMSTFTGDIPNELEAKDYVRFVFYEQPTFLGKHTMSEGMVKICSEVLKLSDVIKHNGIVLPRGLQFRKYLKRVVIQPTAKKIESVWAIRNYQKLYRRLTSKGFEPFFIVAPQEEKDYAYLREKGYRLQVFEKMTLWISFVYESGYFIGNDSGAGHLASSLGVSTLTIGIRKKLLRRWRPDWQNAHTVVIIPRRYFPIPTRLKNKIWSYMLSVGRVEQTFLKQLVNR